MQQISSFFVPLILLLSTSFRVHAQCINVLDYYNKCFFGNFSMNEYWTNVLANYSTPDLSMKFFHEMFERFDKCTAPQCQCVLSHLEPEFIQFRTFNYSLFFLNNPNFLVLQQITNQIRRKHSLRKIHAINTDPANVYFSLDSSTPIFNEYCLKYDWPSLASFFYFDEVRKCLPSRERLERGLESCLTSPLERRRLIHTIASVNCSRDVKKFIAIGLLTWSWELIGTRSLDEAINQIVDANFTTDPYSMMLMGNSNRFNRFSAIYSLIFTLFSVFIGDIIK